MCVKGKEMACGIVVNDAAVMWEQVNQLRSNKPTAVSY